MNKKYYTYQIVKLSCVSMCFYAFYLFEHKKFSRINKRKENQPEGKRQQSNYIFLKRVLCTFACVTACLLLLFR